MEDEYQDWHPVRKGLISEVEYQELSIKDSMLICCKTIPEGKDKKILTDYLKDIHCVHEDILEESIDNLMLRLSK